jgi:hypothetical protein
MATPLPFLHVSVCLFAREKIKATADPALVASY